MNRADLDDAKPSPWPHDLIFQTYEPTPPPD